LSRPFYLIEHFLIEEDRFEKEYGYFQEEVERMDYLEFIARVTSHIPDKGQVMIRYFGLYEPPPA